MLSQTAEHALRAVLYLAQHADEEPVSAEEVAEALAAPRNYLSKTLHELAKQGVLKSTPGRKGGFMLAIRADELSLATVLEVFDTPKENPVCLLGGRPCTDEDPCEAHVHWKRIEDRSRAPLNQNTIADLLTDIA